MRLKNLSDAINPIVIMMLVTVMAIAFFAISSMNQALDLEIQKAQSYSDMLSEEIMTKAEQYKSKLFALGQMAEVDHILSKKSQSLDPQNKEDQSITQEEVEALGAMLKIMYMDDPEVEAIVLQDANLEVVLEIPLGNEFVEASNTLTTPQWMESHDTMFRVLAMTKDQQGKMLFQIPVNGYKHLTGYILTMQVDISGIMTPSYDTSDYKVDIMTHNGVHLFSKDKTVVDTLYDMYGSEIFDREASYNRNKKGFHISDMNYFDNHVMVSSVLNEQMSLVVLKAYSKFAIKNSLRQMLGYLIVAGIMIITMIGTTLYSNQRTKGWVENDRQFLNEIIDMDKIQITELKKEVKFHNDMFSELDIPLLIIDKDSLRIMNVNQEAIKYYGYSESEMLDFYLTDICKWDDTNEEMESTVMVRHLKQDGSIEERRLKVHESLFNDSELLILMLVGNAGHQENMDKMKMEMFHEIRSPLQGAYGAVRKIEDAAEGYNEYTSIIKRSLDSVLNLTNSILAEGKLSKQRDKVFCKDFDLIPLIDEVVSLSVYQDLHYNIIASNINEVIDDTLLPIMHYQMHSDPVKLRQILVNLMSNAIKYTEDGMVNLSVEILHQEDKDIVVFRIADTGIGLTKDQIDHLYDSFETFTNPTDVTSTGLGLTITKKYVEMLGSELHVSSEYGVGTTFSFSLEITEAPALKGVQRKHSILIVDDDEIGLDYLDRLITADMDCHVKTLTKETELLLELNRHDYDILILDQNLNHFKGTHFIDLIRSSFNKRISEIPIILITATYDLELPTYDRLFKITKPYDQDEVFKILNEILIEDQNIFDFCKDINKAIINKEKICETYDAVGREVFLELIHKFQVNSVDEMKSIRQLMITQDFEKIAIQLHRLKGAMSYFAPVKALDMIMHLEKTITSDLPDFQMDLDVFESELNILLDELNHLTRNIKEMPTV